MTSFLKKSFWFLILAILFLKLAKPAGAASYRVKWGDTLFIISQRFRVPMQNLIVANKIYNPNLIYAGQWLIIPDGNLVKTSTIPRASFGEVWVEIDLSKQRLNLYQGRQVIFSTFVSTGIWRYPTPTGRFRVWGKFSFDDMTGGSRSRGDYYYLPKVPHVAYFYQSFALHGTYWHRNFGRPMSHGCVNLSIPDAQYVYQRIEKGTLVVVQA